MTMTETSKPYDLKEAYQAVKEQIAQAAIRSGRTPDSVHMIAVTKTATPDQIRQLLEMGHIDFGESRVQQLTQRVASLEEFLARKRTLSGAAPKPHPGNPPTPKHVRWHMIGHLQRNKVKQVVQIIDLIHSVDSLRLVEEIDALGGRMDRVIDILIQVNPTRDPDKFGVAAPAVVHLAEQISTMMHLRLRGLMAMAPLSNDPEDSRWTFTRTAETFKEVTDAGFMGKEFTILSMGMSNDYKIAIECGANVVRIGRALFGKGDPDACE